MPEKFRFEGVSAFSKCDGTWLARLAINFDAKYVVQRQYCNPPLLVKWKPRICRQACRN